MRPQKKKRETAPERIRDSHRNNLSISKLSAMGLNDNLDFMGRQLHIQTENMSSPAMCIITQVFCQGRVLFSTRCEYPPGICESHDLQHIQDLMKAQHFRVIEKIRNKKSEILGTS